jgi:Holliday junction resolvasome RuvABC DNA-binding subunit
MSEDAKRSDALSALLNLGYQRGPAEKAINAAIDEGENLTVESILRSTLRKLARV